MEEPVATAILPRRPWYRLHLSTWLTLPLGLVVAVFVVVPGGVGRYPERRSWIPNAYVSWGPWDNGAIVHGWPLPYLWRMPAWPNVNLAKASPAIPWKLTDSVRDFRLLPLAADLALAALALAVFAGLVEWRRRRHARALQFSLRDLLVVATAAAIALGWWSHRRAIDREVKDRIAKLRAAPNNAPPFQDAAFDMVPRLPLWLRMLAGDERLSWIGMNGPANSPAIWWNPSRRQEIQYIVEQFPEEVRIEMTNGSSPDDTAIASIEPLQRIDYRWGAGLTRLLRSLKGNAHLRELQIDECDGLIDEERMSLIATLPRLESLYICAENEALPPHSLAELCKCGALKYVGLYNSQLTPDAIACLGNTKQLRWLSLEGSQLDADADLRPLCRLDNLDELYVSGTDLTDAAALRLQDLPNLRCLGIDRTQMTGAGIAQLLDPSANRFAPNLEQISLDADAIDDDVIAALKKLPRLRYVGVTWEFGYGAAVEAGHQRTVLETQRAIPDRDVSANIIYLPSLD